MNDTPSPTPQPESEATDVPCDALPSPPTMKPRMSHRLVWLPMLVCFAAGIGAADTFVTTSSPSSSDLPPLQDVSLEAPPVAPELEPKSSTSDKQAGSATGARSLTTPRIGSPATSTFVSVSTQAAPVQADENSNDNQGEDEASHSWPGFVTPVNRVQIPALVSGLLIEANCEAGSEIEKGELLGQIDRRDQRLAAELAQAKLELATAKVAHRAARDLALLDALQQETLFLESRSGAVSGDPLAEDDLQMRRLLLSPQRRALEEQRLAELDREFQLEAALQSIEVAAAEDSIQQGQLLAPWDGVVTQQFRRAGEWIVAGEAIAELVSFQTLKVEVSMPLNEARADWVGQPCEVVVDGLEGKSHEFEGVVTRLGELVDANYELRMEVRFENRRENDQWLAIPGSRASVTLASR